MVMMLTSIDFWIVKNIVGRKLIKMRWWFLIDNQGNERWYYEYRGKIIFEMIPSYCRYHYPLPRQAGLLGYFVCDPYGVGIVHRDERIDLCYLQDRNYLHLYDHSPSATLGLQELQDRNV